MKQRFFFFILHVFLLFLFFPNEIQSQQGVEQLVSASYVKAKLKDENTTIIDLQSAENYLKGHIEGAINITRKDLELKNTPLGGLIPSSTQLEELLSEKGVRENSELILYDDRGSCESMRLWWVLRCYDYPKVKILDGGIQEWRKIHPLSTDLVSLSKTKIELSNEINSDYYADLQLVSDAIKDSQTILLDTRSLEEYTGSKQKKGAFSAGRIPSSIHMDWGNCVNFDSDMKLRDSTTLAKMFIDKGITPDKNIIVYCQSGVRSAHTSFVLTQLLKYPNVKNYDGSWIEWSSHKDLPVESGAFIPETVKLAAVTNAPSYWALFTKASKDFASYTWNEITFQTEPRYVNYFWWLVFLSLAVWALEVLFPWRKDQPRIRKDFWIDTFYMFFNFYIFKIVVFFGFATVVETLFVESQGGDLSHLALVDLRNFHPLLQLFIFFIATDFIQWMVHVILHRFDFFWQFHKVHHSVEEMGFAAHLRYHWMENVFYTPMKFLMVMLIGGFTPDQAFIVFYASVAIGHLNHANINLSYGPLKYILNNPKMHIWHHAHDLPEDHKYGANFGISLSIWDYLFRTAYIPFDGRDIKLGFDNIENFPKGLLGQFVYGFFKKKDTKD